MISGSGLSLYSDKSPARYPSDISICIFTLNIITGIITEGFCLLDYGQIALQRNPPGLWQKNNGLMVLSSRQAVSSIINMQFFMHFPSSGLKEHFQLELFYSLHIPRSLRLL